MSSEEIETKIYALKLAILGDIAVGKTSLISQYIEQSFREDYRPTLGTNILIKEVNYEHVNTKLIIWDIAGQDKYDLTRKMYFQGCNAAFLVYDITRASSFKNIEDKWLKDFRNYVSKEGLYILIGNKNDLEDSRLVSYEQGEELANKINAVDFFETSAKNGDNVEIVFRKLVHRALTQQGVELKEI